MSSDGWQRAWSTLPAPPRPEPPWEPDEAVIRRAVRWNTALLLVYASFWLGLLLARHWRDGGLEASDFLWPVFWWLLIAVGLAQLHVPGWRDTRRRRIRDDVRLRHALREHVSIGIADRYRVTQRARRVVRGVPALLVGYPVVSGLLLWAFFHDGSDRGEIVLAVYLSACYVICLVVWPRQLREARRWLADPLPREDR